MITGRLRSQLPIRNKITSATPGHLRPAHGPKCGCRTRRRSAICLLAANFKVRIPVPSAIANIGTFPDRQAVGWLAGLIEGDGCIRTHEVAVQSVDHDVLIRAKQVTGCGQIYFSGRQKAHHRDQYAWKLTSRRNIDYVLSAIEPWMLSRRKAAIRTIVPV